MSAQSVPKTMQQSLIKMSGIRGEEEKEHTATPQ